MPGEIISFEVKRGTKKSTQSSSQLILLLCLENTLQVDMAEESVRLSANELLLLDRNTACTLEGRSALYVQFTIDYQQLRQIFPGRTYRFACNSTREANDNYELLRGYLTRLILIQYERSKYWTAEWNQLSYELLIFLVNNFVVQESSDTEADRLSDILAYIEKNYQEELSLAGISDEFHLTPQYFSRYFKKSMGVTYYQYLSRIRLDHAVRELQSSDRKLMHIALDHGFPNVESFSHYFEETYHETPGEYRSRYSLEMEQLHREHQEALEEAVAQLGSAMPETHDEELLSIDVNQSDSYDPFWFEVFNLENSDLLMDYESQKQVRTLQQELGFHYVRIPLKLDGFTENADYSFYTEERKLDYLAQRSLILWFTIDFREFLTSVQLEKYLRQLLSHFANRYSIGVVKKWRFELCYNTLFDEKKAAAYWKLYEKITAILQHFEIQEPLLGPGLTLGNWKGIKGFCEYLQRHGLQLPVQTVLAEPYVLTDTDGQVAVSPTTDSSYIKNQLATLRQHSPYFREQVSGVYITRWSSSILKTNLLKDSCYRGALIIKNIIDCFGSVQLLTHNIPLDVEYEDNLQGRILFGGDGIVSKHCIFKPSYYAYQFMAHVGNNFLSKNEHALVFGNGENNFQIVCHNCKRLSYRYYLEEEHLSYERMDTYFDDLAPRTLRFFLRNLKNGTYVAKIRSVNQEHGSVLDELHRMTSEDNVYVHEHEIAYLRQMTVPQVRLKQYTVTDGTLELQMTLEANEFAYLHLIYQY